MTQTATRFDNYQASFRELSRRASDDGSGWLQPLREAAWRRFTELGFPTARRGNEPWKYTNVRPIAAGDFAHPLDLNPEGAVSRAAIGDAAPWHDAWLNLVFVDGRYAASLSSHAVLTNGAFIGSLADAIANHRDLVEPYLGQHASFEDEAFTALNTAFVQDGVFIYLPPNYVAAAAINVLYLTTGREQPRVTYPRILVVAGRNSQATVNESYISLDDAASFTNAVTEVVLLEGANLTHNRLLHESAEAFFVGIGRVWQGRDSVYQIGAFERGSALARNDFLVTQGGEGTNTTLNGLYLTKGYEHVDNFVNINHTLPHGTSRLYYKGILDDHSHAVFGGTVFVQRGAVKTDAQQTDKNLLLSDDAEVDSKPSLFIYADDVKCGHGATAGHIDEDTVFYMRSRGLDLETASRFLIHAFANEIIETVQLEPLREYLDAFFMREAPRARLRLGTTR